MIINDDMSALVSLPKEALSICIWKDSASFGSF